MTEIKLTNVGRATPVSPQSGRFVHPPNWVDYRSSLANIDRREDRGDTAPVCDHCGCEADVRPVPHSPRCRAAA